MSTSYIDRGVDGSVCGEGRVAAVGWGHKQKQEE